MMNAKDDPGPDTYAWALRLRAFLKESLASEPAEEANRVREAVALLGRRGSAIDDPHAVEAMLSLGAAESAVLRIIGADTTFMLSRGGGDRCLATMVGPGTSGEPEEILAEASTLALALLAAHIAAVIAGIEGSGPAVPLRGCDPR